MRSIIFVLVSMAALGCHEIRERADGAQISGSETVDYGEMLTRNRIDLMKLSLGMDRAQVLSTMGSFQAETHDGIVPNPSKSEMKTKGEDSYETFFYMTSNPPPFIGLRDSEATPVILKNGKLAGWGWGMANEISK